MRWTRWLRALPVAGNRSRDIEHDCTSSGAFPGLRWSIRRPVRNGTMSNETKLQTRQTEGFSIFTCSIFLSFALVFCSFFAPHTPNGARVRGWVGFHQFRRHFNMLRSRKIYRINNRTSSRRGRCRGKHLDCPSIFHSPPVAKVTINSIFVGFVLFGAVVIPRCWPSSSSQYSKRFLLFPSLPLDRPALGGRFCFCFFFYASPPHARAD